MRSPQTLEAMTLLQRLIATPSTSRDEAAAADVLAAFLTERNIGFERHLNNIWCTETEYDTNRPTLLLNAHIDTVRPVAGWQHAPFTPVSEGERLYGLGSNDDGGSLVSLLQAFRVLSARKQTYNLIFAATAEEEVSGPNGIASILPLLPRIDVGLVGEPTGMQPAIAEKGLMVLDITAHGKAGHAAREEGINAIYRAMEAIRWIRDYRFEQTSTLLGPVKMSTTVIQAGTQHNVVPDTCSFTVDVRSNECYSNQEIFNKVCEGLQTLYPEEKVFEVKARSFRLNSSSISREHPLVAKAIALGKEPFGSPTLSDQSLMPFPTMKMGPGQSSRSHTADEFIETTEVDEAISTYVNLLDGLHL